MREAPPAERKRTAAGAVNQQRGSQVRAREERLNTTAGATNPPMPPADLGGWTPHGVSGRAWRSGPFVIGTTPPDQGEHEWTWRAQMALDGGGEGWLDLGRFHPESGSAISACRGVANALQEARRHDEPAPSADHHPPRRRWMKRRA